ncbi:LPXTG cell wall anchor domain-containing protein [Caldibacillus sp. 210928-DFI.2.22]|nr:LPXTG cell wall anchor domain-containing protein [Caldibacillus sp. 210928-DFI.2.22]MCB7074627.1 LPXTG cell wall anchor domain-containing protein [Caldibacillus sp. 210928-DFI.2.18]
MKWLEGKKATEDFANAGNEINLEESSFSVTTNGVYTVYVKNSKGVEVVQTIEINNIVVPAVSIALTPSTTEETEGPVSIKVDADSTSALVELKWLEGKQNVDAFHNAGNPIDLEAKQFDVTENGTYTVYAKNSGGAEAVQTITIDNIKVVEKEEIVITTPSIANGVATISDDDIDRVKNGGTFIIELGKADKVRVFLTADQIKTLKEKQVSLIIRNNAVEIQIPSNNLADGEDISIDVRKVDDVASADQAVSGVYDFTIYAGDKVVSDFGEPIILVFTVDKDKVKSTDKLNVYYYNEEKKKWELIPNAVHKDSKVSVGINHFSTFAVFAKDPNKQDSVPPTNPGGQDPVPEPNPSGQEDPKGPSPKDAGDKNQSIYDGSNQNSGKNGGELPNTATPYNNYFIIGFVLVMIGVAAVYFQYRRKRKTMM